MIKISTTLAYYGNIGELMSNFCKVNSFIARKSDDISYC